MTIASSFALMDGVQSREQVVVVSPGKPCLQYLLLRKKTTDQEPEQNIVPGNREYVCVR